MSADDKIFWRGVCVEHEQVRAVADYCREGDEFFDVLNHVLDVVLEIKLPVQHLLDFYLVAEDDGEVHVDQIVGQTCDVNTGMDVHDVVDVHCVWVYVVGWT